MLKASFWTNVRFFPNPQGWLPYFVSLKSTSFKWFSTWIPLLFSSFQFLIIYIIIYIYNSTIFSSFFTWIHYFSKFSSSIHHFPCFFVRSPPHVQRFRWNPTHISPPLKSGWPREWTGPWTRKRFEPRSSAARHGLRAARHPGWWYLMISWGIKKKQIYRYWGLWYTIYIIQVDD
jgi:hypothetical protein